MAVIMLLSNCVVVVFHIFIMNESIQQLSKKKTSQQKWTHFPRMPLWKAAAAEAG